MVLIATLDLKELRHSLVRRDQGLDARHPHLAMETDVRTETKTRKRMEDVAAEERLISGDNSFAQVDSDPIRLTSFGNDSTRPPALPRSRDDALVDEGAAARKP